MTPTIVAKIFGCTEEQARKQYLANAKQMAQLATRAGSGKYNGYTAAQWLARAEEFKTKAARKEAK